MFSHMMVGTNDMARSKAFYDALFAAMGGQAGREDSMGRVVYQHRGAVFLISRPINGQSATAGNGGTIGFAVDSPAEADAWHKAGTQTGGTAVEDPPGERNGPAGRLYLAYLRDPDGNKLCALHRLG